MGPSGVVEPSDVEEVKEHPDWPEHLDGHTEPAETQQERVWGWGPQALLWEM